MMRIPILLSALLALNTLAQPSPERGALRFDSQPAAQFRFTGPIGQRVHASTAKRNAVNNQSTCFQLQTHRATCGKIGSGYVHGKAVRKERSQERAAEQEQ